MMSLFISVRLHHFLQITTERSTYIEEDGYRWRRWHVWCSVSPICSPNLDAAWVTPDRASTGKCAGSWRRRAPFLFLSFWLECGTLRGTCMYTPAVSGVNSHLCNRAHLPISTGRITASSQQSIYDRRGYYKYRKWKTICSKSSV